jgi:hypothetical protein
MAEKLEGCKMKNAQPHKNVELSALDSVNFNGYFPKRHDTVTAEILSRLLKGETITGMDAVFKANTTRLSAFIYSVRHEYHWEVQFLDVAVGTKDGRIAEIRAFYFSRATIRKAFVMGAPEFCNSVASKRAKLRKNATNAMKQAKQLNARRAASGFNPRQLTLDC